VPTPQLPTLRIEQTPVAKRPSGPSASKGTPAYCNLSDPICESQTIYYPCPADTPSGGKGKGAVCRNFSN
jgi:hypothetical protein